jgi:DNA-3-methyladenine glycosylase II
MSAQGTVVDVAAYTESVLAADARGDLEESVGNALGIDEDLAGFYRFAKDDPILAETIADEYGMRLGVTDNVFGRTILAILLQMAPMARSARMMEDLLVHFGTKVRFDRHEVVLWPRPADLAGVDPLVLRTKATLGYRAERLVKAAQYLAGHPLTQRELSAMPEEETLKRLLEIPGVGPYSAGIVSWRASLPIDVWSVVIMSELVLGRTPENPRREIPAVIAALTRRWGQWKWFAFVYILNDLAKLGKKYNLSRTE